MPPTPYGLPDCLTQLVRLLASETRPTESFPAPGLKEALYIGQRGTSTWGVCLFQNPKKPTRCSGTLFVVEDLRDLTVCYIFYFFILCYIFNMNIFI